MAGAVESFLGAFGGACRASDGAQLLACFRLDPQAYGALQAALGAGAAADLDAVEWVSSKTHDKRFRALAHDYLEYAAREAPPSVAGGASAYDAWVKVFSQATAIFALPDTVWFIPTLKYLAQQLVTLAIRTDKQSGSRMYTKTIDAAGRLSKCAGLAANDRTALPGPDTKRAAVLALANASFRAYFKLNNTRLCETVLGSVQNAMLMNRRHGDEQGSGEEVYPLAERVTYRYYLGQIRLIQHRIQVAAQHLDWAFSHCSQRQFHNRRKILASLVAVHLILGRYASPHLLETFGLTDEFGKMLYYHKLGYGRGVQQELERHCDWLRTKGLYMVLAEKAMLGLWRNLFRRCLRLAPSRGAAPNAPPTLQLAMLLGPARMAWGDAALQAEDIECIAANLVDQVGIRAGSDSHTGADEGVHSALERARRPAERAAPGLSTARQCVP